LDSIRIKFETGFVAAAENGESAETEEEVYGDFEDLETGESSSSMQPKSSTTSGLVEDLTPDDELKKKKEALKRKFDALYDDEGDEHSTNIYESMKEEFSKQAKINADEFAEDDEELRAMVEGRRPGQYVRIVLEDMPCEFMEYFDPSYPVIAGGLLPSEETFGFSQVCAISSFLTTLVAYNCLIGSYQETSLVQENSEDEQSIDILHGLASLPKYSPLFLE
jgi:ribosome biogenesis protein BMS1